MELKKKPYRKPAICSKQIELGVFGDYNDPSSRDGGNRNPLPLDVIRKLDIHME